MQQPTEHTTPMDSLAPPALVIKTPHQAFTAHAAQGPVVIGRDAPAQVRISDERISRAHVRVTYTSTGWVAVDMSSNGTFVNGVQQATIPITDGLTIHLGHPLEGIAISFSYTIAPPLAVDDATEHIEDTSDPKMVRVGAEIAARREELGLPKRELDRRGVVGQATMTDIEKGRRFPRPFTRDKIEAVLGWPRGHIMWLYEQDIQPDEERTHVLTATTPVPEITGATKMALKGFTAAADSLPPEDDPAFTDRVGALLADLRELEGVAASATHSAHGTSAAALVLSDVRKLYKALMLRAAGAPGATLGQRFYAARYRAELTTQDAAAAAGLPVAIIEAAEADAPLDPAATAAVQALLTSLLSQR